MTTYNIPEDCYNSDKACGEYIIYCNELLSKLAKMEKKVREQKEAASAVLLTRLEATGQKHFAFEGLGTFSKRTSVKVSFPTAENGGKEAAVVWLEEALKRGIITPAMLLDLQQARIVHEPALAIEEAVEAYNTAQTLNGNADLMPPSPFNHFEQVVLVSPRSAKS